MDKRRGTIQSDAQLTGVINTSSSDPNYIGSVMRQQQGIKIRFY